MHNLRQHLLLKAAVPIPLFVPETLKKSLRWVAIICRNTFVLVANVAQVEVWSCARSLLTTLARYKEPQAGKADESLGERLRRRIALFGKSWEVVTAKTHPRRCGWYSPIVHQSPAFSAQASSASGVAVDPLVKTRASITVFVDALCEAGPTTLPVRLQFGLKV